MAKSIAVAAVAIAALVVLFVFSPGRIAPLSLSALAEIRGNIEAAEKSEGTLAALQMLGGAMDRYKLGYDFCHTIASRLGQNAAGASGKFGDAVTYPDALMGYCTGGFIHGAAQEYLEKSPDPVKEAGLICGVFKERGSLLYTTCVHGVGHGLMAGLENNLPKALAGCERAFEAKLAPVCAEGVFMQNFDAGHHDDSRASAYMKSDDLLYPCPIEPEAYKARCYNHVAEHFLAHHTGKFAELIQFCGTAEPGYRFACYRGAGRRIVQNNIGNPRVAEALVRSVPEDFAADYIYGVAIGYQEFFPEPGKGAELCRMILQPVNRAFCPPSFR